ncbi:hypothetical protein JD969_12565 [Planctomycetota bacterium]|nr:hypothetical protein JD969_12565 [Planctomycetota bacterium]
MKTMVALLVSLLCVTCVYGQERPLVDAGGVFGELPLIDEIDCATDVEHEFFDGPEGVSEVVDIMGKKARILPPEGDAKYFAYRIGEEKGLEAGKTYLVTVEYPDDAARTTIVQVRGGDIVRGFSTGQALGDTLYGYTRNNSESISYPLSNEWQQWEMMFKLHKKYPGLENPRGKGKRIEEPEEGFLVVITQAKHQSIPLSQGAAVARIRLFEVPDESKYYVDLKQPPKELPRRHLFFREEMGDSAISGNDVNARGVKSAELYYEYKVDLMRFLGMNTFTRDLLEFGWNQGWDPSNHGGYEWYHYSDKGAWDRILKMLAKNKDFYILPYYEYAGSSGKNGLGKKRYPKTLNGMENYTHLAWLEKQQADVTHPDTIDDAVRLIKATIADKKQNHEQFLGAWIRARPAQIPVSFSKDALARFGKETEQPRKVRKSTLKNKKSMLPAYYDWWNLKRKEFNGALRDTMREAGIEDAIVIYTSDGNEPGRNLARKNKSLVVDNKGDWASILKGEGHHQWTDVLMVDDVISKDLHNTALLHRRSISGEHEWGHADPPADPKNYKDAEGMFMTMSVKQQYTVGSPTPFETFRAKDGLVVLLHYPLNETTMHKDLGYFVTDVERHGPFVMMAEAMSLANGDPRYIGYMVSSNFNRGFTKYVRDFNMNFLALPAVPSEVISSAANNEAVVVREYKTDSHGTWYAIINTSMQPVEAININLSAKGTTTFAATGKPVNLQASVLELDLYPYQVVSIHVAK